MKNPNLDRLNVNSLANEQMVKLELTIQEFNTVLASLQELPHRIVDPLLRKIISQAQTQVDIKRD